MPSCASCKVPIQRQVPSGSTVNCIKCSLLFHISCTNLQSGAIRSQRNNWICDSCSMDSSNINIAKIISDLNEVKNEVLLRTAKKELRATHQYIWVQSGNVLVRKTADARIQKIRDVKDFELLKQPS